MKTDNDTRKTRDLLCEVDAGLYRRLQRYLAGTVIRGAERPPMKKTVIARALTEFLDRESVQ